MNLAIISLSALILALALSSISAINVGFLAIVLAWVVGVYAGSMTVDQVIAGFPVSLFLTLVGLTLLFSMAQVNGTLDRITHKAVSGAAGTPGVIPFVFFILTSVLAAIGPGHIAATALMALLAMAAAGRYGIPPLLMAIMVANGASSGSLSPIAPTGVVVEGITTKIGMGDVRWAIYLNNFVAHTAIAWTGYLLLGGWRLLRKAPLKGVPYAAVAVAGTGAAASDRGRPSTEPIADVGRIAPVTTIGQCVFTVRWRKNAVSSSVAVPCVTTTPFSSSRSISLWISFARSAQIAGVTVELHTLGNGNSTISAIESTSGMRESNPFSPTRLPVSV